MADCLVSKYKENKPATKKKAIFSRLIDYFLTFIVTFLLFSIASSICGNVKPVINNNTALQEASEQIKIFINSTHLQRYNSSTKSLSDINKDAEKYVETYIKTNAYIYDLNYPLKKQDNTFDVDHKISIEETFLNDLTNYSLDNVSYYFYVFKKTDESINNYVIDNVDYSNDIETYIYNKIVGFDEDFIQNNLVADKNSLPIDCSNLSRYLIVKNKLAQGLIDKIVYGDSTNQVINNLYEKISLIYKLAIQYGIKDVENNSLPYKNLQQEFEKQYQNLCFSYFIAYLISYFIAYLFLTFFARLSSKRWLTFGQCVMKVAVATTNDEEPHKWNLILYHIISFITFFSSVIIGMFYSNISGVMSFKIIGDFSLLFLILVLIIINIGSMIFSLISKNRFNISSFPSRLVFKDTEVFETPVEDSCNADN